MSLVISQSVAHPTQPQIDRLISLGITTVPSTRTEASAQITKAIAERDMRPATTAQKGRAGVLGGRDLPGAGVREVSSQIALLEALALVDGSEFNSELHSEAIQLLIQRVRDRFVKAVKVTVPAQK